MGRLRDGPLPVLKSAPVAIQFVKFGIVGVSNTLLTLAVYTVLLKVFGVWYLAASAIGFAVGATNGFLLDRRWTLREPVHDVQQDKLLSQVCATGVVTVTTYFVTRAWTFRVHAPVAVDVPAP